MSCAVQEFVVVLAIDILRNLEAKSNILTHRKDVKILSQIAAPRASPQQNRRRHQVSDTHRAKIQFWK
jgi:hypothetical protein